MNTEKLTRQEKHIAKILNVSISDIRKNNPTEIMKLIKEHDYWMVYLIRE